MIIIINNVEWTGIWLFSRYKAQIFIRGTVNAKHIGRDRASKVRLGPISFVDNPDLMSDKFFKHYFQSQSLQLLFACQFFFLKIMPKFDRVQMCHYQTKY